MLSFEKFLILCGYPIGIYRRDKFLLYKSLRKSVLFQFLTEKRFVQNIEAEIKFQKSMFKKLEAFSVADLKSLIFALKLDEANMLADFLQKKISFAKMHSTILRTRIQHYEEFFEISNRDRKKLKKTAARYVRISDLLISKMSKKRWRLGLGSTALLLAGTATYYTCKNVVGKIREKKKEEKDK